MSKLPNHTLWARAANTSASASSSSRATAVLAKSHHHNHGTHHQRRPTTSTQPSSSSNAPQSLPDLNAIAALGAVSAPFYGPQPAAVVDVYEQHKAAAAAVAEAVHSDSSTLTAFSFPASLSFPTLAIWSQTLLANATPRYVPAITPASTPRALHRSMHHWSNSSSTGGQTVDSPAWTNVHLNASKRKQGKARRHFNVSDAAEGRSRADRIAQGQVEKLEELLTSISWAQEAASGSHATTAQGAVPGLSSAAAVSSIDGSSTEITPSPSPGPSPKSTSPEPTSDVGHRSVFGSVSEPPAKFAVTTSAESQISSSDSSQPGAMKSSNTSHLASTSSAADQAGSAGALPPQASAPSGSTDHWAKTFNIPRSSKRHDYMFEHGAYGIPKRHPLSSIRASPRQNAGGSGRAAPTRDDVPSGKIRAATDILSAAADFFVGSQHASSSSRNMYQPFNGQDALQAALAGGSTAEEHELRPPNKSDAPRPDGVHRMAIRGLDGRIIKDRLRSVQVGEDAYFLRPDALGVADGVGGWASRPGADPALFSRLLMHFCAVELSRYDGLSASELAANNGSLLKAWASVDPVEVMHRAWERCVRASRREGILGSSTALIGLLRGDELRIANMGDCVLMIIRRGEMLFRSTEQQHSFNFPVQLGMMGDTTDTVKKHVLAHQQQRERAAGEGEVASAAVLEDYDAVEGDTAKNSSSNAAVSASSDSSDMTEASKEDGAADGGEEEEPEWDEPRRDAGRWTVRVEAGDIIVVGSDGLMDNLFDEDIIEEVLRFLPTAMGGGDAVGKMSPSEFSPQLVSEALCSRAKAVSEDSRAISSPFQQRAMEEGLNYVGGKHDDISVVVCVVGERSNFEGESDSEATGSGEGNSDQDDSSATSSSSSSTKKFLIK